jgi:Beta-propeller repeat
VGTYDKKYPLVIDPVLNFSTYFGGSGGDQISAITTDVSGNIYLVGSTSSVDFPLAGPEQSALASGPDAFISKLDPTGHSLIYSTYLGGSRTDQGQSIAVDVNGNVVVSGITTSSDFPQAGKLSSATRDLQSRSTSLHR